MAAVSVASTCPSTRAAPGGKPTCEPVTSQWAWRRWSLTVEAQPGPISLTARAWDDTGATHPESPASLWNPRGYGNNAWAHVKVSATIRDP